GAPSMCDYSLDLVAYRPAKVGEELVTTRFSRSITRGFTAVGHPDVAVCLLPGTELAFREVVRYESRLGWFGHRKLGNEWRDFARLTAKIRMPITMRCSFRTERSFSSLI